MSLLNVPPEWDQAGLTDIKGVVLVVGQPDSGKSTFSRYLFVRLCSGGQRTAYIDGDPGQSFLGPPTTQTAYLPDHAQDVFPKIGSALITKPDQSGRIWRWFTGSTTPRGHMLEMLVGSARLVQAVFEAGAETVVFDTCGFVTPAGGGLHLKLALVDLLRPSQVVALHQKGELEPLLTVLKRSRRTHLVELQPSPAAIRRESAVRRAHRGEQFSQYFRTSRSHWIDWSQLAVLSPPRFQTGLLLSLENWQGFMLALGIVEAVEPGQRLIQVRTPLETLDEVNALRLGDVLLDPNTFQDQIID